MLSFQTDDLKYIEKSLKNRFCSQKRSYNLKYMKKTNVS
jgi:hypothetical protein